MKTESPDPDPIKFDPKPVRVKFMLTQNIDMSRAAAEFGDHLGALAVQMGFPSDVANHVIVTDTDRFAEALAEFEGKRTFTNSHGLLAVAKTIRIKDSKPVSSAIVFNVSVVGTVLNAGHAKGWKVSEWSVAEQHHFYVVAHELGHCLDHALRPEIEEDGTHRDAEGNRVMNGKFASLHAFHFSILYPELAACVIGGLAYTDEMRAVDAKMNNAALVSMLDEMAALTAAPSPDLAAISQQVAATFWFVLIQHSKFVGSRIGYSKLTEVIPTDLWHIAALPEVDAALKDAQEALVAGWRVYPEIPADLRPRLTECVLRIARACGYTLEVRHGEEGVWWNTWSQSAVRMMLKARAMEE